MTFCSKVDAWLALVLGIALAAILFAAYSVARQAAGAELIGAILLASVGLVLILWPLLSTSYSINTDELLIHSGPFRWRVPLSKITKITPTRSPISSPALSLDRLRIDYGIGNVVLVSPSTRARSSARSADERARVDMIALSSSAVSVIITDCSIFIVNILAKISSAESQALQRARKKPGKVQP